MIIIIIIFNSIIIIIIITIIIIIITIIIIIIIIICIVQFLFSERSYSICHTLHVLSTVYSADPIYATFHEKAFTSACMVFSSFSGTFYVAIYLSFFFF